MRPELPKIRTVHMTNLHLSGPENLEKFLREFRQILKNNFQIITVAGEESIYLRPRTCAIKSKLETL